MDLSSWDIVKKAKISLDGEWEFYGNQLLSPEDFKKNSNKHPDDYILVPVSWNDQLVDGKNFTGQCGTYRLTIIHCPGPDLLALRIWEANCSYKLWVNDQEAAVNGKVSSIRDSFCHHFRLELGIVFCCHHS